MRWPSSPGKGGFSNPGKSRPSFTQLTIRAMIALPAAKDRAGDASALCPQCTPAAVPLPRRKLLPSETRTGGTPVRVARPTNGGAVHPETLLLIVVVVAFAWNLGVHYTGAVMGMPYAAGAISLWPALALIAIFALLGATLASGRVQLTVGEHIIPASRVTVPEATVIVFAAGLLTTLYNYRKVPTSTIQILVFCVVGAGLAAHLPVAWTTIWHLALVWILAPFVACGLGFAFTRVLDLVVPPAAAHARALAEVGAESGEQPEELGGRNEIAAAWFPGVAQPVAPRIRLVAAEETRAPVAVTLLALRLLPALLVAVGGAASFVMGANDVSNATGAFIMTHLVS